MDNERFVDFAFKDLKEIQSNFNNMDHEKNLVGIQRRFDDESKVQMANSVISEDCLLALNDEI